MELSRLLALTFSVILSLSGSVAWAQLPSNLTWTTVLKDVGGLEGLTGDDNGKFYVADRRAPQCTVWEIDTTTTPAATSAVGAINRAGCTPSGLTFDANRDLFITTGGGGGFIYKVALNGPNVPAQIYAEGVPGANGMAFLGSDLFVTDGTENQGRVWKITGADADCATNLNCEEFLRIQPRTNSAALGGNVEAGDQPFGVGSERYTVPRHIINPVNDMDRQAITANGIAFSNNGRLMYVADTSRGAIWAARLDNRGNLESQTGCDPTFHPNTLCMDNLYVAHPLLEGIDGFILDRRGTILASVNERNAIVAVTTPQKEVFDLFQNAPDPQTLLRNGRLNDPSAPLEFPTSPFLSGTIFCTTGADSPRRDNNPANDGEGPKVICADQRFTVPGLPLPIK